MRRAAWRRHVREALERREGRARRLCRLVEQHEKLQGRLETLLSCSAAEPQHQLEVIELRQERQELQQQLAFVTQILEGAEAENREQRTRMQCLAQDLGALQHQYEELQCRAWGLSRETEELRKELEQAWGLLQEAQGTRQELEARWVKEKAREAERLNWANEQGERYQRKVSHLQEKLERASGEAGLLRADA